MSASVPITRPQGATAAPRTAAEAMRAESRLRLGATSVVMYLMAQGLYGSTWDIQWHAAVGRDSFFTPPHLLMYSSTSLAGVIALALILWDTWRFRRGDPGVTVANTTRFLGFHAPLGAYVAGFGMVAMVSAAPFDNYWHELYGIDVTLWAPAHVMGMLGSYIGGLGAVYVFASELNRRRTAGERGWLGLGGPGIGLVLAFFGLLSLGLINVISAGYAERLWTIGPLTLANWPLVMAAAIPICLVAALVGTGRAGVATAVGLLVTAWQLTFGQSVIGMVDLMVHWQNLQYRQGVAGAVAFVAYVSPLLVPVVGLILDGTWWLTRGRPGLRMAALPGAATLGVLILLVVEQPWTLHLDPTTIYPDYGAIFLGTLPVVIGLSLVSGWAGAWWGRVIRSVTG
jgi:hypothetical protein